MKTARAIAHSNIALVKYWGKRAGATDLNLPAVGSLSMTLDSLRTITRIEPAESDRFLLDGQQDEGAARKVFAHLDRVWVKSHSGTRPRAFVDSTNHLPTAAGLASSASGFAALTVAAVAAFGIEADATEQSVLARRGSGSAARSIWGGFVRLDAGTRDDGSDCVARPVLAADSLDVRLLIVHTAQGRKPEGSTDGMQRSRNTSPYFAPWVESHLADLDAAQAALEAGELASLGELVEHSCLKMHACMLATRPPLLYWNGTTLAVIHETWAARREGLRGWVTSDAGPHVKVLCRSEDAARLAARLSAVPGVFEVQAVGVGPAAAVEVLG